MRNIAFETPCAFQKIQKVLAEKTLEQATEIINTIAWVRDTRSEWNYRFYSCVENNVKKFSVTIFHTVWF